MGPDAHFFRQDVECPERAVIDGPLWRAKSDDIAGTSRVEGPNTGPQVLAEMLGPEFVHPLVTGAMRSDFVTCRADGFHESRKPLGDPTYDEERRRDACSVERVEQPPRRGFDARGKFVPAVGAEGVDATDVEPILEVDSERVWWPACVGHAGLDRWHLLRRMPWCPGRE